MNAPGFKRNRPIIGILTGRSILEGTSRDNYRASILRGIQSAAQIRGCDIVVSWGIRPVVDLNHVYSTWPIVSPESDFIPVGPWNMDGLIVFTPLGNEDNSLYLQKLIAQGYPVLFLATGEQGPQIAVDNKTGIRQAMIHLAKHGHRRIAFIAGIPTDKGDSAIRLQAYHTAMEEYGLEANPQLVAWGWHIFDEGYRAMQSLLTSGVEFTAVMASNDNSAAGAMQAIREAGRRIPDDIAIIGFDNEPIAEAQVPPLSSIHIPLEMMGEQALVAMLDHLTNQMPLGSLQIPTRLVKRQSCGCVPETISSALTGIDELLFRTFAKDGMPKLVPSTLDQASQIASASPFQGEEHTNTEKKQYMVDEMLNVLPAELRYPGGDEIRRACTNLVETFCKSLHEANPTYFQTAFTNSIYELERVDGNLGPWQDLITTLRREMILLPLKWGRDETRHLAEGLLHQARVVVSESAQRQGQRHEYQRSVNARNLNDLTASLSSALSERQAVELINSHLSKMNIRHLKVLLFEAEQDDPVAWSLALNANADSTDLRFPSRQFPPPGLYPADELLNIILLPLVFQNEVFGYIAIEANDLTSCLVIATQLAATIKVARLHTQIVELSLTDSLTGLHNRRSFEIFLKNEVSRSQRFSRSLAIIFVDIDNFKEYNDTYGHPAGDVVLQQVAKCLSAGRRVADIVARIGGDEFVMILPETEINGALKVSRKIRAAVTEISSLKRPISVSIGLTAPGSPKIEAELTLQQADQALYESKRMGKNRISVFENKQVLDEKEFPISE